MVDVLEKPVKKVIRKVAIKKVPLAKVLVNEAPKKKVDKPKLKKVIESIVSSISDASSLITTVPETHIGPVPQLPDTEAVVECRNFIQNNIKTYNNNNGTFHYVGNRDKNTGIGHACHYSMKSVDNPLALTSVFNSSNDRLESAMQFWNWITSKDSPYAFISKNGIELVVSSKSNTKGFILPEKTVKEVPFNPLKNFCIMMRVMNEYAHPLKTWKALVDGGMSGHDALYLCYFYVKDPEGKYFKIYSHGPMSGSHWHFTDSPVSYHAQFDWDAYYKNSPHLNEKQLGSYCTINRLWCKTPTKEYRPFHPNTHVVSSGSTQSKFSSVRFVTLEDIINGWNSYKKEYILV